MNRAPESERRPTRPRVLAIACACHPTENAESRVGWARVVMASEQHQVVVLCESDFDAAHLKELALNDGAHPSIQFEVVPHTSIGKWCYEHDLFHFAGYRMWHRGALRLARRLHAERPFDLVHQINYCGYREPGYGWTLGVPFVWGPLGGTQGFSPRYLSMTSFYEGAREVARNVINGLQLRFSRRIRRAADSSAQVLAATRHAQRDLKRFLNVDADIELEAGLSYPTLPMREQRDPQAPLRILWTGRLRAWKGLPLLLHALARMPAEFRYELRVLGVGKDLPRLKRLAARLGVAEHTEWVGWGPYPETLPHYEWAEAFAFTSLRDTTGAGLLEALAAGVPIVGLDHQGAADIMDNTCALPIKPSTPGETSLAFAHALQRLADDPALWRRLSRGASRRAVRYEWSHRQEYMNRVYRRAMHTQPAAVHEPALPPHRESLPAAPHAVEQVV